MQRAGAALGARDEPAAGRPGGTAHEATSCAHCAVVAGSGACWVTRSRTCTGGGSWPSRGGWPGLGGQGAQPPRLSPGGRGGGGGGGGRGGPRTPTGG